MIVDAQVRIRAIERSLRDVVIPAIDPARKNALEQAEYMAKHLQMLLQHLEFEYAFALTELRDCAELTRRLATIVGPNPDDAAPAQARRLLTETEPLAATRLPALMEVKQKIAQLRAIADALLRVAQTEAPEVQRAAHDVVLEAASIRERRDAAWVSGKP
ncbi:MAG: hypothetical protein ABW110_12935 [Steroidobacteraceae bacterium]